MEKRENTRKIMVGNVQIGGENEEIQKILKEHVTLFRKNVVTDAIYLEL